MYLKEVLKITFDLQWTRKKWRYLNLINILQSLT